METMKARVLREVGNLEYCDYPMPEVKPDEVLFRVRACGVCGSDIPRIFVNGTYHFPTIPGHEYTVFFSRTHARATKPKGNALIPARGVKIKQ